MNTKRMTKNIEAMKTIKPAFSASKVIYMALTTNRLEVAEKRISEYFDRFVKSADFNIDLMEISEEINDFYSAAISALIEAKA